MLRIVCLIGVCLLGFWVVSGSVATEGDELRFAAQRLEEDESLEKNLVSELDQQVSTYLKDASDEEFSQRFVSLLEPPDFVRSRVIEGLEGQIENEANEDRRLKLATNLLYFDASSSVSLTTFAKYIENRTGQDADDALYTLAHLISNHEVVLDDRLKQAVVAVLPKLGAQHRFGAIRVCGLAHLKDALPALIRIARETEAENEDYPYVIESLGQIPSKEALSVLLELLVATNDDDDDERQWLIEAILAMARNSPALTREAGLGLETWYREHPNAELMGVVGEGFVFSANSRSAIPRLKVLGAQYGGFQREVAKALRRIDPNNAIEYMLADAEHFRREIYTLATPSDEAQLYSLIRRKYYREFKFGDEHARNAGIDTFVPLLLRKCGSKGNELVRQEMLRLNSRSRRIVEWEKQGYKIETALADLRQLQLRELEPVAAKESASKDRYLNEFPSELLHEVLIDQGIVKRLPTRRKEISHQRLFGVFAALTQGDFSVKYQRETWYGSSHRQEMICDGWHFQFDVVDWVRPTRYDYDSFVDGVNRCLEKLGKTRRVIRIFEPTEDHISLIYAEPKQLRKFAAKYFIPLNSEKELASF